jgi:hypothetical protein
MPKEKTELERLLDLRKKSSLDLELERLKRFGSTEESVRVLQEATGWSEADILSMPVERANTYLDVLEELKQEGERPCQKRFLN